MNVVTSAPLDAFRTRRTASLGQARRPVGTSAQQPLGSPGERRGSLQLYLSAVPALLAGVGFGIVLGVADAASALASGVRGDDVRPPG